MAQSQKRSWLCCFRPRVAEAEDGSKVPPSALKQEKEDSANGDGPARLSVGVPERTQSEELEDFGSPASSYVTCFSEQDPHDIGDSLRWAAGACACSTERNIHNPMAFRDKECEWGADQYQCRLQHFVTHKMRGGTSCRMCYDVCIGATRNAMQYYKRSCMYAPMMHRPVPSIAERIRPTLFQCCILSPDIPSLAPGGSH